SNGCIAERRKLVRYYTGGRTKKEPRSLLRVLRVFVARQRRGLSRCGGRREGAKSRRQRDQYDGQIPGVASSTDRLSGSLKYKLVPPRFHRTRLSTTTPSSASRDSHAGMSSASTANARCTGPLPSCLGTSPPDVSSGPEL